MAPPAKTAPKSREAIATETALGWFFVILGAGIIVYYMVHKVHGHIGDDKLMVGFGSVCLVAGGFAINKKMTMDFAHFVRDLVVFWRKKGDTS